MKHRLLVSASLLATACSTLESRGGADCDIDFTSQASRTVLHVTHESEASKGSVRLFIAPVVDRSGEARGLVPVLARERDNEFLVYAAAHGRVDLITAPYEMALVRDEADFAVRVAVYSALDTSGVPIATGSLPLVAASKPLFASTWVPKEWDAGRSLADDPLHELRIWLGNDVKLEFALLESSKASAVSR